ncbi:MAG: peptidylprolyl isomerase [Candidatus Zixiibacteriota bacterium]|jgi:FKBP-type peptidyl-prolyl cis-trans isomerase 2
MPQAKSGDKVKVHYTGKLEDNTVFDSSKDRPPLEFTIGSGSIIPGFENAVIGMETGQSKTFTIPPDEAYGQPRDELKMEVNKSDFPDDITPEVGQQLQMKRADGNVVNVVVANMEGEKVTLDANHPLAGKALTFDIELVEIA